MIWQGKNRNTWRKNSPSAPLSTTGITWTDLGSNASPPLGRITAWDMAGPCEDKLLYIL
jgi:hypothetical protein